VITTWGTVARARGLSHRQNRNGKLEAAWTFNDFDTQLPKDPITVTLNHRDDMAVGELVFGEIAEDGRVQLVCVVDDLIAAADGEDIYYSGEWQLSGVNGDGVAFTIDNAQRDDALRRRRGRR
jgi:hypothetical protein